MDVGLVICEGPKSWHRSLERRELALVLEGVITIDRATGRNVVSEGTIVSLPPEVGLKVTSGMRTTVVVFRPRTPSGETNGYEAPLNHEDKVVEQVDFAKDVLQGSPNNWKPAGAVGGYSASATRMAGVGGPFAAPGGNMLLLVYRGVLDYDSGGDDDGTVVGSQSIVVPQERSISLRAPRGATVVALARASAVLPTVALTTPADDDPGGTPSRRRRRLRAARLSLATRELGEMPSGPEEGIARRQTLLKRRSTGRVRAGVIAVGVASALLGSAVFAAGPGGTGGPGELRSTVAPSGATLHGSSVTTGGLLHPALALDDLSTESGAVLIDCDHHPA